MIPDEIDQNDPRRNGERMVFEWFSNNKIVGTTYYSLWQKNHIHKLIGEVDFLYVCERGLLCVEVKGGQKIERKDQKWYSTNKLGQTYSIHNPFKQAKDCSYALKKLFADKYGKNSKQADYLIGYAVVFPECRFTGDSNDLVTEVVFDARYSVDDFNSFLNEAFDYWESQEIEKHGFHPSPLSLDEQRQVNDLLRGDFSVIPSLSLTLQNTEKRILRMTEEQKEFIDNVECNDRVLVEGSAGTGKTILALEKMRRSVALGRRVLFVCFNRNIAEYVKMNYGDGADDKCCIITYHSLLMQKGNIVNGFEMDVETISKKYLESDCTSDVFDEIIMDEGQDLLYLSTIDVLSTFLKLGFENGRWTIFYDGNQNIFNSNSELDFTLNYINSSFSVARFKLNKNCRNTQQIVNHTVISTGVPPSKHRDIQGVDVEQCPYNKDTFKKVFREKLQSYITSGYAPSDIVVLSKYKLKNSMLSSLDTVCNLPIVEQNDIGKFNGKCLNFYTIHSFKGLESKTVFLIDIDSISDDNSRMLNYIGMTRAKLMLYCFYDEKISDEYLDYKKNNILLLMNGD